MKVVLYATNQPTVKKLQTSDIFWAHAGPQIRNVGGRRQPRGEAGEDLAGWAAMRQNLEEQTQIQVG